MMNNLLINIKFVNSYFIFHARDFNYVFMTVKVYKEEDNHSI